MANLEFTFDNNGHLQQPVHGPFVNSGQDMPHANPAGIRSFQSMVPSMSGSASVKAVQAQISQNIVPHQDSAVETVNPPHNDHSHLSTYSPSPASPGGHAELERVGKNGLYNPSDSVYRARSSSNRVQSGTGPHTSIIQTRAAKAKNLAAPPNIAEAVNPRAYQAAPLVPATNSAMGDIGSTGGSAADVVQSDGSQSDEDVPAPTRGGRSKRRRASSGRRRQRKRSKRAVVRNSDSEGEASDIDRNTDVNEYDTTDPFIDDSALQTARPALQPRKSQNQTNTLSQANTATPASVPVQVQPSLFHDEAGYSSQGGSSVQNAQPSSAIPTNVGDTPPLVAPTGSLQQHSSTSGHTPHPPAFTPPSTPSHTLAYGSAFNSPPPNNQSIHAPTTPPSLAGLHHSATPASPGGQVLSRTATLSGPYTPHHSSPLGVFQHPPALPTPPASVGYTTPVGVGVGTLGPAPTIVSTPSPQTFQQQHSPIPLTTPPTSGPRRVFIPAPAQTAQPPAVPQTPATTPTPRQARSFGNVVGVAPQQSLGDQEFRRCNDVPDTCEVTNVDLQDQLIRGIYIARVCLRAGVFESWSDMLGPGMVMFSAWARSCPTMSFDSCLSFLQFTAREQFINPSSISPRDVLVRTMPNSGGRQHLYTLDRRPAICVSAVCCTDSSLTAPATRGLRHKYLNGIFHSQEWERFVGLICTVFGHRVLQAQLNKDSIQFSTRAQSARSSGTHSSMLSGYC